jgi:hypothetical protein
VKLIKIVYKKAVYYIDQKLYDTYAINKIKEYNERQMPLDRMLLEYSQFALDRKNNTLSKCRGSLEELLDMTLDSDYKMEYIPDSGMKVE